MIPLSSLLHGTAAVVLLSIGEFVTLFCVLVYNITQVTLRQRLCPPRLLGRMNASIRCLVWGVMPIASLVAGALGSSLGIVATIWIAFGGGMFAGLFVLFSPLPGMRELPTTLENTSETGVAGEPASRAE